jgi:hypothetical protein
MSSPRARITLRPELVMRNWLDTMMRKSLRKIGKDRQGKQRKEVCLHEKEEVQERFWLV